MELLLLELGYFQLRFVLCYPAVFDGGINFTQDTGDPKWLTRDYRAPWSV